MKGGPLGGADGLTPVTFAPIGVLRSPHREKVDAPRQPRAAVGVEGTIELAKGRGLEDAVQDLSGFRHVWVIAVFDRDPSFHPKVRPPRSTRKRGVLATRSPHRPNPIALSVFELLGVEGLTLRVRNVDLLDGTPVLDVKPYVAWTDAIAETSAGWLEEEQRGDPGPRYAVAFDARAVEDVALLTPTVPDLEAKIRASLALGAAPHAYRRIKRVGEGYVLAVKDVRVHFDVRDGVARVRALDSGYRDRDLADRQDLAVHRVLRARYRSTP